MGIQVTLVAMKLLIRGKGLKVSLVTAASLSVLVWLSMNTVPEYLLLAISVPSITSIVLVDSRGYNSAFYALNVVGATPRQMVLLMAVLSFSLGTLISLPYVIMSVQYFIVMLMVSSATSYVTLLAILRAVKTKLTSPIQ